MPQLSPPDDARSKYRAISLEMIAEPLRTEIKSLLAWKRNRFSPGRGYKGRHRDITATQLELLIGRFVAFLVRIKGVQVSTLEGLLTRENVEMYVTWLIEEREWKGISVRNNLSILFAAAKHYPPLLANGFDPSWMKDVLSQIPPDPESLSRRSKAIKWVDFAELQRIPDIIAAEIAANPKASKTWVASMVQKRLVLKWLTTLPWRQRNLREARLSSLNGHPNVFLDTLPPLTPTDLPPWAEAALKANPKAKLWQYDFDERETKAGRAVHGVLPRSLVSLLEDFVTNHRPTLLKGTDPGTLFVNNRGTAFSGQRFCELVARTALRYVKRWVPPHIFRDIFAVAFLKETRDWLALSKILWHKNPKITVELYGRFFDESFSARLVEEWFDGRE